MAEKHWLDKIIEKYGNDQNNGKDPASKDPYEWKMGGNGEDSDGDGKKEYDCSHFLNRVLKDHGYNNRYQSTSSLNKNSSDYDGIEKANLQKGDIVLFNGHIGFFYGYDEKGNMLVYSSSGSERSGSDRGPVIAPASWFGKPTKFLRPKSEYGPSGSKGFFGSIMGKVMGWVNQLVGTATTTRSPILLDLDGDGVIKTLGTDAGIHFDHDGNGFKELSGWVAPGDGMLMLDRDADSSLDNGSELFGNFTPLANGMLAVNGFQALAQFDTNGDGKIDANDPIWSQLKVWQHDPEATDIGDPDSSGILTTLSELGIQSINTGYANSTFVDANGNAHKEIGSFTWNNGTTNSAEDVWFQTDKMNTIANEWLDVPEDIAALPDLQGYGNVYDLQQAMVRDTSGELKNLVEQFMNETDSDARHALITQILYKWAGVENVDPLSRAARIIYGNAIKNHAMKHLSTWTGAIYKKMWFNTAKGNNIPKLAA